MAASAGRADANVRKTLDQLNHARNLCLGDPSLYIRIVPGCMPLISANAHLELRRWGADFLAETYALPVLSSEDKQNLVPNALPVLKEYLDTPGQDFAVVKSVIQAAASIYPLVFRYTLSTTNNAEFIYWNAMMEMKSNILRRMDTAAPGLRICCIKFIQQVVLTQTSGPVTDPRRPELNDISSALVPRDHPLILAPKLEAEASGLLDRILGVLHEDGSDALIVTATLNSLGGLLRSRPSIGNKIVNAVLSFNPFKMAKYPLTSVGRVHMRSIERTTRSLLQSVVRRIPNHPQALRVQQHIERLAQTRFDVFDGAGSRKRPLSAESSAGPEIAKRQKLGAPMPQQTVPPLPAGPVSYAQLYTLTDEAALKNFDVKNIPIDLVVRVLVPLLISVDRNKMAAAQAIVRSRYEQVQSRATQSAGAGEEDDDYEPDFPGSETAEQVKNRVGMDASEEYAVQMPLGPFKLEMPRLLSQTAADRLNQRYQLRFFDKVNKAQAQNAKAATPAALTVSDRLAYMAFIERFPSRLLFGMGYKPNKPPRKLTDRFREKILEYVLADWRRRIDLAVSWLTEEWDTDRDALASMWREHEANGIIKGKVEMGQMPNYKRWLGKLLDELAAFIGSDIGEVKILVRLLSEVPELDASIIVKVKRLALDPERTSLVVHALRYLVMYRLCVRNLALDALEDMWRNYHGAKSLTTKPLLKWRPGVVQETIKSDPGADNTAPTIKAEAG